MTDLVAADIGGTHARFTLATVERGRVVALGEPVTLRTADHLTLEGAWRAFGAGLDHPLPRAAAIAVASPVGGEVIRLTNNAWVIRPALLPGQLNVDAFMLLNDFGAVGHAVAQAPADRFEHICGPEAPIPVTGVVTVCGPGTGLGVAQVVRTSQGYQVIETEGGHIGFAPLDPVEDAIVARLRARFGRVSAERVCAGPALRDWYETLAAAAEREVPRPDDQALWTAALDGSDGLASAALERFCLALGAVAGDLALAQGAKAVVIAGGLGLRLAGKLRRSGFSERFAAKGRFRHLMEAIPVKLITHPQPGLFGAATAFAQTHG